MISRTIACTTHKADHIPGVYGSTCRNTGGNHVCITGGKPCAVVDHHLISIAVIPTGNHYCAAVDRHDRGSFRSGYINALMRIPTDGIGFTKMAGYIGISGNGPHHFTIR